MAKLLFAGSFDPPTTGHIDLIRRASKTGNVTVGIFINPEKEYLFSTDERAEMLRRATADIPGTTVITCDGYTADYARDGGYTHLVRGYRNDADLSYEREMATYNRNRGGIETLLLAADPALADVSSTLVRAALASGDLSPVAHALHPTTLAYLKEIGKL